MIQLEILTGTKAGTRWVARRFPVRVGRDRLSSLCLTDDGVWEQHAELRLEPGEGCLLVVRPEASTLVNGAPVNGTVRLRSGDRIEFGSTAAAFALSPTQPAPSTWTETLVWISLAALCLGQVALIYLVLP